MKKIIINGFGICDAKIITGIPRAVREIMLRLDKLIQDTELEIEYVVKKGALNKIINLSDLKNIKVKEVKNIKYFTKYIWFPRYVRKNNGICVLLDHYFSRCKNHIATLYDIRPYIHTNYDSEETRNQFKKVCINNIQKYSKYIITDSNYQKELIAKHLEYDINNIKTIYLGWEHIKNLKSSSEAFDKLKNVNLGEYFYSLGSIAPHKNYKWIYEVAKRNPDKKFIIAGGKDIQNWGDSSKDQKLDNIHFVGYVSDEENKFLMENCKAFLFPSKFEGFGIPPLEAISCGAKVCMSNATCLPEVYGDSVAYFEPDDYEVDLDELVSKETSDSKLLLEKYSWDKAAKEWFDFLYMLANK